MARPGLTVKAVEDFIEATKTSIDMDRAVAKATGRGVLLQNRLEAKVAALDDLLLWMNDPRA
jgi:hypothetical protein